MTKLIDASSFLSLAVRGHRKRIGKEPRVHLSSTTVDVQTKAQIVKWVADMGATQGVVLDKLTEFGSANGFLQKAKRRVEFHVAHAAQLPKPRSVRAKA